MQLLSKMKLVLGWRDVRIPTHFDRWASLRGGHLDGPLDRGKIGPTGLKEILRRLVLGVGVGLIKNRLGRASQETQPNPHRQN